MATTTKTASSTEVTRNGSRFTLWHLQIVLLVLGLLVTGYLSYLKIVPNATLVCIESGVFSCEKALASAWSSFHGIPTAVLGFTAHVMIGALLLLQKRVPFFKQYGLIMLFGLTLFGVMYHSYLIYVSAAFIKAFCPWCLTAGAIMLLQLIVSGIRLSREGTSAVG